MPQNLIDPAAKQEKEKFSFEEMELKALVYLCVTEAIMCVIYEAPSFKDESEARKKMESDLMKIIDNELDRKRKK